MMNEYKHIDASKFEFVQMDVKIFDKKFETKPLGILVTPFAGLSVTNRA